MSALDELRFGPQRTLNLRATFPTAAEAVRRTEAWLRQHQVKGSTELLIITGRGSNSVGGVAVLKPAVEKLLFSMRRRGVIASHREHNPGAFAVTIAPLRALADAPPRRRDRNRRLPEFEFHGLAKETVALLRALAERTLAELGATADPKRVDDEMHRHVRMLMPGLPAADMEQQLQATIRAALAEYD